MKQITVFFMIFSLLCTGMIANAHLAGSAHDDHGGMHFHLDDHGHHDHHDMPMESPDEHDAEHVHLSVLAVSHLIEPSLLAMADAAPSWRLDAFLSQSVPPPVPPPTC